MRINSHPMIDRRALKTAKYMHTGHNTPQANTDTEQI